MDKNNGQPKKWKVTILYYVYYSKNLQKFDTEVWSMQPGRAAVVAGMKLGQADPNATVIRTVKVKEVEQDASEERAA